MSMGFRGAARRRLPLEDRQLASLPLLLSPVGQPEHRLVPHPGEQEDLLDLRGGGHPAQLVVHRHSNLGLQQPLLLLSGCHTALLSQNLREKSSNKTLFLRWVIRRSSRHGRGDGDGGTVLSH